MAEEIKVTKIILEDQREYFLLDKIVDEKYTYFFLTDKEEILLRKTLQKDNSLLKLDSLEEMAYAFELFFKKHPELRNIT